MKKICYITTLSVSIKSFFIPQLKCLVKNGYDVTVICSPDNELQSMLGGKIKYIPVEITRGISTTNTFKTIKKLKVIFKEEQFDLVQYSTPNAALCASIAAKSVGIKVRNYHLMGLRFLGESGIKRCILKSLEKYSCKNSTHIECVSKSNLELALAEKIFSKDKATVVWNGSTGGVDLNRFDYSKRSQWRTVTRKKLQLSEDDFVFGFVGRITKDKGVNELLEAYQNLTGNSKLVIIGNKEGLETINGELWDSAIQNDNIIILEPVNNIEKYYASFDILVLPSYREGFGMVIAEAAAMGTPAIVSNIPGPIDVVQSNVTAILTESKNAIDLQKKMQYALDNSGLISEMSDDCVGFIRKTFDSDQLNKYISERKNQLIL